MVVMKILTNSATLSPLSAETRPPSLDYGCILSACGRPEVSCVVTGSGHVGVSSFHVGSWARSSITPLFIRHKPRLISTGNPSLNTGR